MPSRRRIALTAGLVAIGAAAAVTWFSRRREVETGRSPVVSATRATRNLALARIGTRAGGSYALHRARKVFASAERQEELDTQFELKTAEQVADALGNMKGALMKIGQMASYLDQGLPEPVREALAQLQQDAPPMSGDLAAKVIELELGAPPDQLFEEWDERPIASASIGQVHRAITREGVAVAVKVQYPDIDDAIRADLDNAGLLFSAIGMLFPGLDPQTVVKEIRERVIEELDYVLEASNQRLFVDYYRDHPFIHIPPVVDALSTRRVLTTELATGARFDEMTSWSQDEKNLAAEAIYRFVFRSLYRLHAFNGDPHPGNYLFQPGGDVTFLDFGLVKHFTPAEVGVFQEMITAMVFDRDPAEFRRVVERIGMLPPHSGFSDQKIEDYFGHFYEFVRDDKEVTITPDWSSESMRRYFDATGPYADIMKAANVPASFVIIQRINLGLFAILGQLQATANWRRIGDELWPWVDAPPSTPLGEVEAAWRARTGR
jgi:predicted unusual protein kinase regulating ubiquinone biosynthesis (AarF/ABC1/UbiB family)